MQRFVPFFVLGAALFSPLGARAQATAQGGATTRSDSRASAGRTGMSIGRAVRATHAPVLDGRDDDEIWRTAPAMDDFRQFAPVEDGDPAFRTEVRAAYDDRNLYVLVRSFDPHPDSIVSLLSRRDVKTNSDQVKILIDGYLDHRTGIELAVNPSGVKRDASIYSDNIEDLTWDGIWDAVARIDSLGWVAEFRIPFGQIRFNKGTTAFGFGVWRDIARRNERVAWPVYRTSSQTIASQLGRLEGIGSIERGSRLELLPYSVTKNVTQESSRGFDHPQKITAGADLKFRVTPNLTVDATVNPDFGQVEADPAVLNLSAFEIRFEERRPFFQEGVGLFKCGGPCEGVFYTRRIGRAPQLRSSNTDPAGTTILGATKITGRLANGLAVGLVDAVTRREEGEGGITIEPRTNYLVGRLVREMRQGSSQIGMMVTAVNRDLDPSTESILRRAAYTTLFQGYHRFAQNRWEAMFYTGQNLVQGSREAIAQTQLNSVHFYQRPDHEEHFDSTRTSLFGNVVGGSLTKLAGAWRYNAFLRRASAGLELNDLGFVPTVNDVSIRHSLTWQAMKPGQHYRSSFLSLDTEQHWTTGWTQAVTAAHLSAHWDLLNSWGVGFTYSVNDALGANCIACARGGPALRQSAKHDLHLQINGDPRSIFIPTLTIAAGGGDDQHSYGAALIAGAEFRVSSRFSMRVEPSFVRRNDDQQWIGNFGALFSDTTHYTFAHLRQTTMAVTSRVNWTASPTLSVQLYAQPFVSTGAFTDWREIAAARATSYNDRYASYGGGVNPTGFNYKQFNSNAVARWEYRPGSTLYVVWQQGRLQDGRNPGSFAFARDYRDLFRAHPDNTVLVKLSYWFNP
ncbi:MAG: DUF5916 domain-containing protein [Gemmatimonadaceae bacterium]